MFYKPNESFVSSMPFDLLSIDIMSGRDVGLQPYNQIRHLCGQPLAKDFEDLANLIHVKVSIYDFLFDNYRLKTYGLS